jgi:hypothetical protein
MNVGALYSSTGSVPLHRQGPLSAAAPAPPASELEVPPPAGTSSSGTTGDTTNLTPEALALLSKLKSRDTEVRQHEQAHLAAAGGLATSGASYTYERGPNGVDYAIGGEVQIDTAPGATPEETISRARVIQAAALAPAEPSGADRAVAAQASLMEQQARAELAAQDAQQAADANGTAASSTGDTGSSSRQGSSQAANQAAGSAPAKVQPPSAQQPSPAEQLQNINRAYGNAPLVPPKLDIYV